MKLGLLGIDGQIASLLAAASRCDEVVLACDVPLDSPHTSLAVDLPRDASWEALLDVRVCDAVLIGADGWSEYRADGMRKLVQAGRTLLVSQPLALSMLWAYEIDMIRKDSGSIVIPFLPARLHPYVGRLSDEIEASLAGRGSVGTIETITMERRMHDRFRDAVLGQLARDADLVRVLVGDPQRLSTLGNDTPDTAWNTLAVGFTNASGVPVRWHILRGNPSGLKISLIGSSGVCEVDMPDDPLKRWQWSGGRQSLTALPPVEWNAAEAMLSVLHDACDKDHRIKVKSEPDDIPPLATWADAARAIELAETVPRSIARGRGIDLHQEEFSEIGTFKGTMASLGCAIVLGVLLVLFMATLLGGIAKEAGWQLGEQIAGIWPLAVLAVLGVFLCLQVLPFLIRSDSSSEATPSAKDTDSDRCQRE